MLYSGGSLVRARAAADIAGDAYVYFSRLFSAVDPDIAVVVAYEADWPSVNNPYGLPFFRDERGEIRSGVVVMPAGGGDFWVARESGSPPEGDPDPVWLAMRRRC